MKKALLMLLLFMGSICLATAQNLQEVVYLKNGSIVRGVVIEQVPGVSLKVQTADGSIFAYQMSEVVKITKEPYNNRKGVSSYPNNNIGNETGYKAIVDLGYTVGTGDFGVDRIELSTSFGYQFNPYFYAGAGLAANYYYDADVFGLPIFAHVRGNILNNNITPFVDFKIGYSPLKDAKGLYLSPSVGCKINSLNVSLGYTLQKASEDYYGITINCGGISFKVGYEF